MALTIEITPEIEQQLRQDAKAAGLSPDVYALRLIHKGLKPQATDTVKKLSQQETDLIQAINTSLSEIDWQRYQVLIEKRQEETLSSEEYNALLALTDQLEKANANRLEALIALAQLRETTLDELMADLDLKPLNYG